MLSRSEASVPPRPGYGCFGCGLSMTDMGPASHPMSFRGSRGRPACYAQHDNHQYVLDGPLVPSFGLELLFIGALMVLNGFLAMSELAIVSARKGILQQRADAGDRGASVALGLAREPGRFLSTVQIGITSVGIVAGAFGGATLSKEIEPWVALVPWFGQYREAVSFGLVVAGVTYLSLVVGELVPKQLALAHAEVIAIRVARPMQVLARIGAPLVWVLSISITTALRLLGVRPGAERPLSMDEFRFMVRESGQTGTLHPREREIVEETLRIRERRIGEIMTPRPRVCWLNVESTEEEVWDDLTTCRSGDLPVCAGGIDIVLGTISARALFERRAREGRIDLASVPLAPPRFVVDQQPIIQLLETFRGTGIGLAIVMDEHGSVVGVVTPTDLLEAIIGDAVPFGKQETYRPTQRPDGSWLLDGLMPLDSLRRYLTLRETPSNTRYHSLGGFIFSELGRVPHEGDCVTWEDWEFEVVV